MPEVEESTRTTIAREPIRFLIVPRKRFLPTEAADGRILLVAAALALIVANSAWVAAYLGFWQPTVGLQFGTFHVAMPMQPWINDGLMANFYRTAQNRRHDRFAGKRPLCDGGAVYFQPAHRFENDILSPLK